MLLQAPVSVSISQPIADSFSRSLSNLVLQTPILIVAVLGLLFSFVRWSRHRGVAFLSFLASLILLLVGIVSPIMIAWLPAFTSTTVDGATVSQPYVNGYPVSDYNVNLVSSVATAIAILLYLIAAFTGRSATTVVTNNTRTTNSTIRPMPEVPKIPKI